MFLNPTIITLIVIIFIFAAVLGILNAKLEGDSEKKEKATYRYTRRNFFLSRAEHEFYDVLVSAVGSEYFIFAQVHLPTLVDHGLKGQNWKGALSHINRKSVDFVLCDKAYISPKLAIELDEKSHERPDRQERDQEVERILQEAGMPLLRIKNNGNFVAGELIKEIKKLALK